MKRQSLLLTAPRQLALVEEEVNSPHDDEILVKALSGAVSIGTELPIYAGRHRGALELTYPMMTGYESVGQVIEVGRDIKDVRVGDRIVAFFGHRTHATLKSGRYYRIPDDFPSDLALLTILSCDVSKGIAKLSLSEGDRVLITGAGVIGLLTLFNLKAQKRCTVDVIEPYPNRRDLALKLGADRVFNVSDQCSTDYDAGFECSSRNSAFAALQCAVKANGQICVLADGNIEPMTLQPEFHNKELQMIASSDGEDYPGHARWFFNAVQPETSLLHDLFDLHVDFHALPQVFEQLAAGAVSPIKILIQYP